ncbi:rhodanese domain-containing protein CG4456-like [Phymastichus coffea]|uniref:rhodanese domain-containing protein CG4456-like n=1 Tax=Phymastichus coffea TaxID=108790 RepID=UPI00273AB14F|nr:rhodanese domain-containing protein CG4456-like [Phymastichus coffea]
MFVKKINSFKSVISLLKGQQFQKLSTSAKYTNNKLYFTNSVELFNSNSICLITSTGKNACNFTAISGIHNSASPETNRNFIVEYNDILKAQKDDKVLIIDVRENSEIQETGKLPGSIHIPMGEVANALVNLSSEEFEKKYNKKQPAADTKIILSCKLGKRSGAVQSDLQKLGYTNAYNYLGGWLDWESRQK